MTTAALETSVRETEANVYKTSDTPKAAYLKSEGFEITGTELNGERVSFLFESSEALIECVRKWDGGDPTGGLHSYFTAYRLCIKLCKKELLINGQ